MLDDPRVSPAGAFSISSLTTTRLDLVTVILTGQMVLSESVRSVSVSRSEKASRALLSV